MLINYLGYTPFMEGQKEYLAAIAAFPKINTRTWQSLTGYFPTLSDVWMANFSELRESGLKEETASAPSKELLKKVGLK